MPGGKLVRQLSSRSRKRRPGVERSTRLVYTARRRGHASMPSQTMNRGNTRLVVPIAVCLVAAVSFLAIVVWYVDVVRRSDEQAAASNPRLGWLAYDDQQARVSFRYPPDWTVVQPKSAAQPIVLRSPDFRYVPDLPFDGELSISNVAETRQMTFSQFRRLRQRAVEGLEFRPVLVSGYDGERADDLRKNDPPRQPLTTIDLRRPSGYVTIALMNTNGHYEEHADVLDSVLETLVIGE